MLFLLRGVAESLKKQRNGKAPRQAECLPAAEGGTRGPVAAARLCILATVLALSACGGGGGGGSADTSSPTIPTGVVAAPGSSTEITLSWSASTDNVGVAGYRVARNGNQVGDVSGTTYTDRGLTPNTSYTYTVTAYDAAGNVSGVAMMTAATSGATDTSAPSAPANLSATATSTTQINLSWNASTDNVGVTGYRVFRGATQIATPTGTSYNDTGLTPATLYQYTVRAVDAAGNLSAASNTASATTQTLADTVAPSAPGNLTATAASATQVNLSWSASTDNVGVTGYRVFRAATQVGTPNGTTFTDTNLTAGTTYQYTVRAIDAAGNVSGASNTASATTLSADTTPPTVPTGLTANATSQSQINLSWNAASDNIGVAGYRVLRNGTQIATTLTTSYSNTGLSAGTTYNYTVAAYDAAGNVSNPSASVSATTQAAGSVIQVGPTRALKKPSEARAVAVNGSVIEIDAGVYQDDFVTWTQASLTLRGVGGRAHLRQVNGTPSNGKAIWTTQGADMTIENIEFSGAKVPDLNGAGIRAEGNNLTIRNCYFHDNENGILGGGGHVLIEHTEFDNNGYGDLGRTHNIYIDSANKFTLRYSYSHRANIGHLVKSRAKENHILYNRLTTETGSASYEIDIPEGGLTFIIGNAIQQGPNNDNSILVAYAQEALSAGRTHELYVINNTMVNDHGSGVFVQAAGGTSLVKLVNNLYVGPGTAYSGPASATQLTNLKTTTPGFVNQAGFDYHLVTGSPAINAGSAPGSAGSVALVPTEQYVHPVSKEARPVNGAIDLGAFEF